MVSYVVCVSSPGNMSTSTASEFTPCTHVVWNTTHCRRVKLYHRFSPLQNISGHSHGGVCPRVVVSQKKKKSSLKVHLRTLGTYNSRPKETNRLRRPRDACTGRAMYHPPKNTRVPPRSAFSFAHSSAARVLVQSRRSRFRGHRAAIIESPLAS